MRKLRTGTALLGQFATLSFIFIALISAALSLAISYYLRKDLLEREWGATADFIRTEAQQNLTASDFADPASATAEARFRRLYQQAVMMPEIVRVKIYDGEGRVIWSDEPRLIGERFSNNPQLAAALAGRRTVNLEGADEKNENVFERDQRELVEVYVPIVFQNDSRVLGVVETYKQPGQVFLNIRRGQLTVVSLALAGGALLYLSLFWIVRRAGQRIDVQHQALQQRSRELTQANDELRSVQVQLVESERMAAIGEVVAAVAHGIRNPLANIRASAQVALLDCTDCAESSLGPKSMGNIIAEVDRLEGRLKELLTFLRPAERRSQPVDLNEIIQSARDLAASRAAAGRVVVEEDLASSLPPITGDPMLLEQVFVNLIANAIEAMPDGGRIKLVSGSEQVNGTAQLFAEVRDTGPGIAPDEVARVFRLFYTTKAQGTGLGLAIAKKFTEAHGGAIAVETRPGEGAAFRVTLPVRTGN
jgi:two-component system, NtrC family, sensor histidine kinase HydH